jgi:hypothetical protein
MAAFTAADLGSVQCTRRATGPAASPMLQQIWLFDKRNFRSFED